MPIIIPDDLQCKVTANYFSNPAIQMICPAKGESTITFAHAVVTSVPESFAQGMRELAAGDDVDLDQALDQPPPVE